MRLIKKIARNPRAIAWIVSSLAFVGVASLIVILNPQSTIDLIVASNPTLWVLGNLLSLYIFMVLTFFTAFYGLRFKFYENPTGLIVFSFVASLVGAFLLIIIGVFIDGRQPWYEYPQEILWWRAGFRDLIYLPIAVSSSFLAFRLVVKYREQRAFELSIDPRSRGSRPTEDTISNIETR